MKTHTKYFPLFVSLEDKSILIFGAGKIATRRINSLLSFCPRITVVAPEAYSTLPENIITHPFVTIRDASYQPGEIHDVDLVIAATDQQDVNHAIYLECKEKNILVGNAANQNECDFFFPAIVETDQITLGLCSHGQNHSAVRKLAASLRDFLS